MKLIGIDGGGTKTEAVLFNETGHILGRHRTGPCNPNLLGCEASMSLEHLVIEVYRHEPAFVASFAPLAFEADAAGDAVARDILVKNARAFAQVLNHAASAFDCGARRSGLALWMKPRLCCNRGNFVKVRKR